MGGAMTRGRHRDRSLAASLPLIVFCLAVAGCSSFSSASNQAAAVPPNSATAAASQPAGPDPDLMPYPQQSLIDVFRGSTRPGGCHASSSEHLYSGRSALFATGRSSCQRRPSRLGTAGWCSAGRRSGAGEYRPVRLPSLPKAIAVRSVHRKARHAVTVVHRGPEPN